MNTNSWWSQKQKKCSKEIANNSNSPNMSHDIAAKLTDPPRVTLVIVDRYCHVIDLPPEGEPPAPGQLVLNTKGFETAAVHNIWKQPQYTNSEQLRWNEAE